MSSSLTKEQEAQTNPPAPPSETKQQGVDTRELEQELLKMTVATQAGDELVGKEERRRSVVEAAMGDIKGEVDLTLGGWEMIWVEDLWTGKWETVQVPREEADYRRRRGLPQRLSYWGESEAQEWRRCYREEKEAVSQEERERPSMAFAGSPEEGLPNRPWTPSTRRGGCLWDGGMR